MSFSEKVKEFFGFHKFDGLKLPAQHVDETNVPINASAVKTSLAD